MKTKNISLVLVLAMSFGSTLAKAEVSPAQAPSGPSLEDQLQTLSLPPNEAPIPLSSENLYSVQTRYVEPKYRIEFAAHGGNRFSGDTMLRTQEAGASLRFYLTNRLFLQASGSKVYNQLSGTAKALIGKEDGFVPDSAYASARVDGALGYNLFYGKFRLSMDSTMYFDHYVSLGAGSVQLPTGWTPSFNAETGLQFWATRNLTFRLGIKDYFYKETRLLTSSYEHNITGIISLGWIFGGGNG